MTSTVTGQCRSKILAFTDFSTFPHILHRPKDPAFYHSNTRRLTESWAPIIRLYLNLYYNQNRKVRIFFLFDWSPHSHKTVQNFRHFINDETLFNWCVRPIGKVYIRKFSEWTGLDSMWDLVQKASIIIYSHVQLHIWHDDEIDD